MSRRNSFSAEARLASEKFRTVGLLAAVSLCLTASWARGQDRNTAYGDFSLNSNTTGDDDTALGSSALFFNTTGSSNTATGRSALFHNDTGAFNTAAGVNALFSNTNGSRNTANGSGALANNTIGNQNTSNGEEALFSNTGGLGNNAIGSLALHNNTTGEGNIANGVGAMYYNLIGNYNIGIGTEALHSNKNGNNNTAIGAYALTSSLGSGNVGTGYQALANNVSGQRNTAAGLQALASNTGGSLNIALGYQAGSNLTTGNNNIDIGALGAAGESNTIRIGKGGVQKRIYVQGIFGATVANGSPVRVDSMGHLGTFTSSARFKDEIKPMKGASEALLALEPVTFRYKPELDPDGIPQFGLVAEEVEKVSPDLVVRDAEGKVNTVRYEAVNAMLLNEFLKEHRKVQELETALTQERSALAQQQKGLESLAATVRAQASQIAKVSARIDVQQIAPQVAATGE